MNDHKWVDTVIDAGATLDWITPTLALVSRRPVIAVPENDMVITRELLRANGIRVKHEQLFDRQYLFTVAPGDLDPAIQLLGGERRRGPNPALWFWTLLFAAVIAAIVIALGVV